MSIQGAFDALGLWTVSGVTRNYGLDDWFGTITQADMPALLVLPNQFGSGGLLPVDLALSFGECVVEIDHHLITSGIALDRPQERFYEVLGYVDAYFAEVKADWTLNDNLVEPLRIVGVRFGLITLGADLYYGATFRHRWKLVL